MKEYICKICGRKFTTEKGLSYHISHSHDITLEQYYLTYECKDPEHAGKCLHCGKPTLFLNRVEGYNKYCSLRCSGIHTSEQGHKTMLEKYGKKALNNPAKNKQYYLDHPEAKEAAYKALVKIRKERNNYKSGSEKSTKTKEKAILDFELLNNCTNVRKLEKRYNTVCWYVAKDKIFNKSDILKQIIGKKWTVWHIKNSAIYKIDEYLKENEFNQTSHGEKSIVNFIKSIYSGKIVENTRKILDNNFELDIYCPEVNLAIEYDGIFWHSLEAGTPKDYHFNKTLACELKGINLIHIYECQWNDPNKQEVLKSILRLYFNSTDINIIKANSCIIKEIDLQEALDFAKVNSLYQQYFANINIGLYYNNQLTAVLSFKNYENNTYVCMRYIVKLNTRIIDGFNNLFNYFRLAYRPNIIYFYSDYNININNNLFSKNNINFIEYSKFGIISVINNKEASRLKDYIYNYSDESVIKSNNISNRLLTIYNAGVKKYIWNAV